MPPFAHSLVYSNLFTLALALALGSDAAGLIWSYWTQSVVIGWYARRRLLEVDRFSTEGFAANGERVSEDGAGKQSTARVFTLHYGIFHLVYLVFLSSRHPVDGLWAAMAVLACGLSFVWSQRQTYEMQHAADLRGKPNLGALMFLPYLRIVPIHMIVLVGGMAGGMITLVVFTALKTFADIALDRFDRRIAITASAAAAAADASPP